MKSMTGFGRARMEGEYYRIQLEIKSVNSRFLDISIRSPRYLNPHEDLLRREISETLSRGKVDLFLDFSLVSGKGAKLGCDFDYLDQMVPLLEEMNNRYGLEKEIELEHLIQPTLFSLQEAAVDQDMLASDLKKMLREALGQMLRMRCDEGDHLQSILQEYCGDLEQIHSTISQDAPALLQEYHREFRKRLTELLRDEQLLDESRLEMEVALLSERKDIQEELGRIDSHLKQCRSMLLQEEPVGRSLDFLVQELNREINTIGSKSAGYGITAQVLRMKNVLEQFREQVQNVE